MLNVFVDNIGFYLGTNYQDKNLNALTVGVRKNEGKRPSGFRGLLGWIGKKSICSSKFAES